MKRRLWATIGVAAAVAGVIAGTAGPALAEGDETLGPAGIEIAEGSGFAIGGVGMFYKGQGTISVDVPAGATVKQVLLYWDGQTSGDNAPDDTAVVEGTDVTGTALSSAPIPFFEQKDLPVNASAYRADITDLGVVVAGANSVDVSGLDFQRNGKNITNGAGILVVYDDGSGLKDLAVLDGVDTAFAEFPSPRDTTVPQTYTFEAADVEREATFVAFASSVFDDGKRPNTLKVTIGDDEQVVTNPFKSTGGREYDAYELPLTIPAGVTSVTIQAISGPDDGSGELEASLVWTMGALAIAPPGPPPTVPPTVPPTTPPTMPPTSETVPPPTATVTSAPQVETTTTTITVDTITETTDTTGTLPQTGSNDTMPLLFAGLGLVLVGGATVLGVRRFRSVA